MSTVRSWIVPHQALQQNQGTMLSGNLEHDHEQLSNLLHDLKSRLHHEPGQAFGLLDLFWARLAVHIRAENLHLFPAILNAPRELFDTDGGVPSFEEARTIVDCLRSDHNFFMDELSQAVKTFREIMAKDETSHHGADRLATVRERMDAVSLRLESHNALEEDRVYRWPRLILSASELENLSVALRRELENLPRRFTAQ